MRTKALALTIILLFNIWGIHAQKSMFDKLSAHKDISTVYISKSLLKMMPDMDFEGADIKKLSGKLEQMEIYNSNDNKEAAKLIRDEVAGLGKSKTYEVLMKIKDKESNITFFTLKEKDKINDLVMFVDNLNDCTVIRITGNFTAEDIQGAIDGAKPKDKK